jgi:hypothetical protein
MDIVRIFSLALWQLLVLTFLVVVWANLFGEYALYHNPIVDSVSLILFLAFGVIAGTVIPLRRWRRVRRRTDSVSDTR